MKEPAKPPYEIHPDQITSLIEQIELHELKSPKVRLTIIQLLKEGVKKSQKVKLSWNLVESFVDDLCENEEGEMQKNCRRNIRALFEGLEDSPYSLYSFSS